MKSPPEGIRTPGLQSRSLMRYPAAPRTDLKGSDEKTSPKPDDR